MQKPYLDSNVPDDKPPNTLIPIYRELRDEKFNDHSDLAKQTIKWLNTNCNLFPILPANGQKLLSRSDGRWVLCLDGLDEIRKKQDIQNFACCLRSFIDDYPRVKVILSSRPDAIDPNWRKDFDVVIIASLTDEDIFHHFSSFASQEDQDYAKQVLGDYPELFEVVRNPLYLKAFANVIFDKQDEPIPVSPQPPRDITIQEPPKGDLPRDVIIQYASNLEYDKPLEEKSEKIDNDLDNDVITEHLSVAGIIERMLSMLLEHDSKNLYEPGQPSKIIEGLSKLKLLAAKVDGQGVFDYELAHKEMNKILINRYMSLGLIECVNTSLKFPHPLFQVYMAADHIWRLWRYKRKTLIAKLISQHDGFWLDVQKLFVQIAHENQAIEFINNLLVCPEEKTHK